MKVAPLLAQYFYANKRLDLPGLGTFLLDPSVVLEPETGKQHKAALLEGVSFESNPAIRESPELVQYISSSTGKIKALAAADLDSHLSLALQFLHIGKPFLFEGIGSLSKIRAGEYQFYPAAPLSPALRETITREQTTIRTDDTPADYKTLFYQKKGKSGWKKPVAALLLIGGLAFAIWGGYTVYKKTIHKKERENQELAIDTATKTMEGTVMVNDTSLQLKTVSSDTSPVAAVTPTGSYKFILETSTAPRAFSRFTRLKTFQWDVRMETTDSLSYKIFMVLPVGAADTTRVIDSLSRLTGKRVYIEP